MQITFFKSPKNLQELKTQYKNLAFQYHPDVAGDTLANKLAMQKINAEYKYLFNILPKNKQEAKEQFNIFEEILNQIITIPNIEIEICGSWVWVGGDTKPAREALKKAGFLWAGQKKKWYWKPAEWVKTGKRVFSMEEIRTVFGSKMIEGKKLEQIAG